MAGDTPRTTSVTVQMPVSHRDGRVDGFILSLVARRKLNVEVMNVQRLFVLDPDVAKAHRESLDLKPDVSRLRVFVLNDGGHEYVVQVRLHVAAFGNEFEAVPLSEGLDRPLHDIVVEREALGFR